METWEYLVLPLEEAAGIKKSSDGVRPSRLNELGSQGWEAVGFTLKRGDLVHSVAMGVGWYGDRDLAAAEPAIRAVVAGGATHRTAADKAAAPNRVQTWTVPGASHTRGLSMAPAAWTGRVLTFLDDTLARTTR